MRAGEDEPPCENNETPDELPSEPTQPACHHTQCFLSGQAERGLSQDAPGGE